MHVCEIRAYEIPAYEMHACEIQAYGDAGLWRCRPMEMQAYGDACL
jgi:hypothetical protein